MRTLIKDIEIDKEVEIRGFVDKFRDLKFVQFIIVSDVSGSIQVTIDKELNKDLIVDSALTAGSTVIVKGKAISSPSVKLGGVEFIPTEVVIETLAEVSPISTDSSSDLLLDYRWIDLRQPQKRLVFQVQTTLIDAMRRFVLNKDFIEIHTPKLSAISSEGGSEVFKTDYFGQEVFLTQSPQLYKQMAIASGFDKVFEIGEAFRAEKSYTNKHFY
jgi:aspartyl-tRNA synthetase